DFDRPHSGRDRSPREGFQALLPGVPEHPVDVPGGGSSDGRKPPPAEVEEKVRRNGTALAHDWCCRQYTEREDPDRRHGCEPASLARFSGEGRSTAARQRDDDRVERDER